MDDGVHRQVWRLVACAWRFLKKAGEKRPPDASHAVNTRRPHCHVERGRCVFRSRCFEACANDALSRSAVAHRSAMSERIPHRQHLTAFRRTHIPHTRQSVQQTLLASGSKDLRAGPIDPGTTHPLLRWCCHSSQRGEPHGVRVQRCGRVLAWPRSSRQIRACAVAGARAAPRVMR